MDIARWMIARARYPRTVVSIGERFGPKDHGETPNTQLAFFDFSHTPTRLIFEVRGLATDKFHGADVGNIFHLEEGTIVGNNKFIPKGKNATEPLPDFDIEIDTQRYVGNHYANFINAVRSRKKQDLTAEINDGFYSSALCHLANASYRVGPLATFDQASKALGDDKDAQDTLARMQEHLKKNQIPLDGPAFRLGKKLKYNADLDNVSDPAARPILTGTYRKGFEVPGKVL
jgi:hypothetical protein